MRFVLAGLAVALCAGCSIIYNPNNIQPRPDAPLDAVPDADPTMPRIDDVLPALIYEGAGSGNSRPALVVIHGRNFVPDATVTFTPSMAATLVVKQTQVSFDHDWIAVTVEIDPDANLHDGAPVALAVSVAQDNSMATANDTAAMHNVALQGLEEYPALGATKIYSKIVASSISFTAGSLPRAVFRTTSSISITGAISASGAAQEAGPGGCRGGSSGTQGAGTNSDTPPVNCQGRGNSVGTGLLGSPLGGGGAGFVSKGNQGNGGGGTGGDMTGNATISSYSIATGPNVASGGGGGANTSLVGGPNGAAGGGGGGTVELTAGGDITVGAITANGADGLTAGGGPGGGGAGGVIMIRAGATASFGALSVQHGKGGGNFGGPGDASDGRIRVDSAAGMQAGASGYIGPMFVGAPLISTVKSPMIMLRGTANTSDAAGRVIDSNGVAVSTFSPSFLGNGIATPTVTLTPGYNKICVTVANAASPPDPESTNCIEMAFLP
jgi:hypothetical protein